MKKILLISLILLIPLIQGCILPPIMCDDNDHVQAKVSVDGFNQYGVTFGTQNQLYDITMMGQWSTIFDVYVGDIVYLEVRAGSSGVVMAIELYQNYTHFYENHIYVYSYTTEAMSVEILNK